MLETCVETERPDAAEAQAKALGVEAVGVYVRHPIQDRTDDEMREIGDEAFEAVLAQLVREVILHPPPKGIA